MAPPRSGMHLVDRQRLIRQLSAACPAFHPGLISPPKRRWVGDDRGRPGRHLRLQCDRVGLQRQQAARAEYLVLIDTAWCKSRYETLPHPGLNALAPRVAPSVPGIEFPYHRDAARVRRPDRKTHAVDAIDAHRLSTQHATEFLVPAFRQ